MCVHQLMLCVSWEKGRAKISRERGYEFWGGRAEELLAVPGVFAGLLGACMVQGVGRILVGFKGLWVLLEDCRSGVRCHLSSGVTVQTCPNSIKTVRVKLLLSF